MPAKIDSKGELMFLKQR